MGNIFEQLSMQRQATTQPGAPAPAPSPSVSTIPATGGNIFEQLKAGRDVEPDTEEGPDFVDPADKGVVNSLKRNTAGLLRLPGHVIRSFDSTPRTDAETGIKQLMDSNGTSWQTPIILGFKRLILDPMVEEHKLASEYDKHYDTMTPEEKQKADEFFNATSERHMANMHHIASVVPILGPAAAQMVSRGLHGDESGALTDALFNVVTAGAIKAAAGKLGRLAPGSANIGGKTVPVLASQAGEAGAGALEDVAKTTGSARSLTRFVQNQAQAVKQGLGGVADSAVQEAVQNFTKAPSTVLTKANNFEEASQALRTAASPHLDVVDKATKGRISEILDERDALLKKQAQAQNTFGKWREIQKKIADLNQEEDDLFKPANPRTGRFQKIITKDQRADFSQAVKVWKQASAMQQVHAAIEGASDAGAMAKRLGGLDQDVIEQAVGGSKAHAQAIQDAIDILKSGSESAKVSHITELVRWGARFSTLGGSEKFSYIISKILTSPNAAKSLASGLKLGMSAPVIAQSIDNQLQKEEIAK